MTSSGGCRWNAGGNCALARAGQENGDEMKFQLWKAQEKGDEMMFYLWQAQEDVDEMLGEMVF